MVRLEYLIYHMMSHMTTVKPLKYKYVDQNSDINMLVNYVKTYILHNKINVLNVS